MEAIIRHIPGGKAVRLGEEIAVLPGQIVSKTLAQNKWVSITLFGFDEGEEISTHESEGDALIQVLEGSARITIGGEAQEVAAGESIRMPARIPHAVEARQAMKMLLTVVFPGQRE